MYFSKALGKCLFRYPPPIVEPTVILYLQAGRTTTNTVNVAKERIINKVLIIRHPYHAPVSGVALIRQQFPATEITTSNRVTFFHRIESTRKFHSPECSRCRCIYRLSQPRFPSTGFPRCYQFQLIVLKCVLKSNGLHIYLFQRHFLSGNYFQILVSVEIVFCQFVTNINSELMCLILQTKTIAFDRRRKLLIHRLHHKILCSQYSVCSLLISPFRDAQSKLLTRNRNQIGPGLLVDYLLSRQNSILDGKCPRHIRILQYIHFLSGMNKPHREKNCQQESFYKYSFHHTTYLPIAVAQLFEKRKLPTAPSQPLR